MRDTERVAPSRNDAANKQILYKHTVRKGPLHMVKTGIWSVHAGQD